MGPAPRAVEAARRGLPGAVGPEGFRGAGAPWLPSEVFRGAAGAVARARPQAPDEPEACPDGPDRGLSDRGWAAWARRASRARGR
ncbi:hypothetical protein SCA03_01290 [Streptomyces cacaoi]|uniref:Uncharacterized protein n=1 Tax=Streptomyces cacaoi TaxID=1898 RepID=A0A4Y3QT46_STRCI|nr:hypothetical protein SCA03_01290 [Streptomyces cacaoi]